MPSLSCLPNPVKDWAYTLFLGALVTSYWRGTWVLLDIWLCGQPPEASLVGGDSFCFMVQASEDMPDGYYWTMRARTARVTYGVGLALLVVGVTLLWSGVWLPRSTASVDASETAKPGRVTPLVAVVRWIVVYILGASAVCLWRGIWYWADAWILPSDPLASYWTTSLAGSTAAFLVGAGASLLAPPAIFLTDGPGEIPPPVGVTLVSSYYSVTLPYDEKPPQLSLLVRVLDLVGSFVALPFAVVWFWRGTWLLLDNYFWGFTLEVTDVHYSKLWGTIFALVCLVLTSEPVFGLIDRKIANRHVLGLIGRLRTWVLAWGTVSFWRVIWYIWDEFLGGTSSASAWASHVISLACLTAFGCVSSINAPASTMGVDATPHEKCADEPLFAMIPIPYELIYLFAIGRQVPDMGEEGKTFETEREVELPATASTKETVDRPSEFLKSIDEEAKKAEEGEKKAEEGEKKADEEKAGTDEGVEVSPSAEASDKFKESESSDKFKESEGGPTESQKKAHNLSWSIPRSLVMSAPDGMNSSSYFELQRPQLSSRKFSGSSVTRPGADNSRVRSKLHRSR